MTLVNARLVGDSAGKRHSLGRGTLIAEHQLTLSAEITEATSTATPLKAVELEP